MQNPPTTRTLPQRKIHKFLDTKMLIASLSVAVTVGVWNLLANDAYLQAKTPSEPNTAPPPQSDPAQGAAESIPTLVPLMPVTIQPVPAQSGSAQPTVAAGSTAGQLRPVSAPTQAVVQKVKPQFGQAVNVIVVNGGGGGGGGAAAATTRSSR